ncbi:MAG TPA: Asp-tRNA(Asn)/Glu-tRNA(Gln) amidotransferase subunit GatC [Candidatus Acidoferrales bacterium]|nr:Asp-tRNA(Asn)/Glu-tRNA(Gln) amidotransferase subunit GatC [Candidatus Acidoferrales bacterium]
MPDYSKIDRKLIDHICQISRLELTDSEKESYTRELSDVLSAFKVMEELKLDEEPAFHPVKVENVWREDEAKGTEWDPLGNSRHKEGKFFKGPKIV